MKRILFFLLALIANIYANAYSIVLSVQQIDNNTWSFSLDMQQNDIDFTACQMDISILGEESEIQDIQSGQLLINHIITLGYTKDDCQRIVAHSNNNDPMASKEGTVITFTVNGNFDEIIIKNIVFATQDADLLPAPDISSLTDGTATYIDIENSTTPCKDTFILYNLSGQKVSIGKNGVYIWNHKKIFIK